MPRTRISNSTTRAAHIRREFDVIAEAREGIGASSLIHAICVEAVSADQGHFETSGGEQGYAWNPLKYKTPHSRIAAAGSSLGRVLAGANCDRRTYQAFMEGIYQVTVNESDDVTERIERLWDQQALLPPEPEPVEQPSRLKRFFNWLGRFFSPDFAVAHQDEIDP